MCMWKRTRHSLTIYVCIYDIIIIFQPTCTHLFPAKMYPSFRGKNVPVFSRQKCTHLFPGKTVPVFSRQTCTHLFAVQNVHGKMFTAIVHGKYSRQMFAAKVHGKCSRQNRGKGSRQMFMENVHGICFSTSLDGGPIVNPEIQLLIFFKGEVETGTPPLGQGFWTAWLIKSQQFPWTKSNQVRRD